MGEHIRRTVSQFVRVPSSVLIPSGSCKRRTLAFRWAQINPFAFRQECPRSIGRSRSFGNIYTMYSQSEAGGSTSAASSGTSAIDTEL